MVDTITREKLQDERWGEPGLLQPLVLAMSLDAKEFEHFYGLTRDTLRLGRVIDDGKVQASEYDNASLLPDHCLDAFTSNVLNPSLSRKAAFRPSHRTAAKRRGSQAGTIYFGLVGSVAGPAVAASLSFWVWLSAWASLSAFWAATISSCVFRSLVGEDRGPVI